MADTPISPSNGSIVVSGAAPLIKQVILIPSATSVAITGNAPATTLFEPTVCSPGVGSVVVTSYAPRMDGWAAVAASSTTWTNL